jgi:hypothetical protein
MAVNLLQAADLGYTAPTAHIPSGVRGAASSPPHHTFDSGYVQETRIHSSGYWDEDDMLTIKILHGTITHEEARSRLAHEFFHGCFLVYTSPMKDTVHHILYRQGNGKETLLTVREDNAGRFSCGPVQNAKDLLDVVRRLKLDGVPLLYPIKGGFDMDV